MSYFVDNNNFGRENSEIHGIENVGRVQILHSILSHCYSFLFTNPHPELGSYIQIIRILYSGGAALLIVPVYLSYDHGTQLYQIRKCNLLQQIGCVFVQLIFSFSLVKRIWGRVETLWGNKTYIVNYFDVANESVLNLYIYWHLYIHWFQRGRIEKYVNFLQTTTLLRFDSTSMWKIKAFPIICWPLCVYLSFSWIRAIHQVDFTSMESILRTGESNAKDIFWFDVSRANGLGPFFSIIAILSRFYNCFFHHSILNNFTPLSMLPMLFLGEDFYEAIFTKDLTVAQVTKNYKEYKNLMKSANNFCRGYLQYYILMTVTFNSVHLFETLNTSDPFWKSNMLVYDFETWLIMWIPTSVALQGRKMKKWLWKDRNYMSVKKQSLAIILHDLIPRIPGNGFRAGRNVVVTSAVTGKVIATMWSYSIMALQTSAKFKAKHRI